MNLVDARGVTIEPGDIAIWGYSSGSCPAMAEGVVMGASESPASWTTDDGTVSLTASGRVRVRVTRRSRWGGSYVARTVTLAPKQFIVLKAEYLNPADGDAFCLPPSPLPTQEDDHA